MLFKNNLQRIQRDMMRENNEIWGWEFIKHTKNFSKLSKKYIRKNVYGGGQNLV